METTYDFPVTEKYSRETLRRVQRRLYEMGKTVTRILEEAGIDYFLICGSLLGAVRHGGFIPWDDDFDLFLMDEQYTEAKEALKRNLPPDMLLQDRSTDPVYWPSSAKVRDLGTIANAVLYPDDNLFRYRGLNVDLYRMKKVPRDFADAYRKLEHIEFLVRKHDSGALTDEFYLQKFTEWTREFSSLMQAYNEKEHDDRDCVYAHYGNFRQCEIGDVYPLKRVRFEDTDFWGPNHPEVFLRALYGDYMKIPEYGKRKPHYDSVLFLDDADTKGEQTR